MSAQRGGNLLSYLPPEQRQRVMLLIQRLQEQTEAKNKLQVLYTQARGEIGELQLKCSQLKDENAYLKQQLHSSFSMIAQVRENFKASSKKRKQRQQGDWQDEEELSEEENHQDSSNLPHLPPKPILKSLEKYRPQMTSADKQSSSLAVGLNLSSSSLLNQSGLSGKGREVQELRRQVRALQAEKQREEEKSKQITEKHRLVDEIKSRYRGRQDSSKCREDSGEKIDISDNFLEEDHQPHIKERTSEKKAARMHQEVVTTTPIAKLPHKTTQQSQPSKKIEKQSMPLSRTDKEQSLRITNQKPSSRQIGPSQDYCDVLDLINDYNL